MTINRLWLLAHQDDEIFGLHIYSKFGSNCVVYLTDGVRNDAKFNIDLRIQEAQNAWKKIDENAELIFFGTNHAIEDGALASAINASHLSELISICRSRNINEIVTLQNEGGHQDHDITSMLAKELSRRLVLNFVAFPAYRAVFNRSIFYAVMSSTTKSMPNNIKPTFARVKITMLSFSLMKNYRSQIRSWIGLGPFIILKYLVGNTNYLLQSNPEKKKQEFPEKLLYLNRKKHIAINYESFQEDIAGWKTLN